MGTQTNLLLKLITMNFKKNLSVSCNFMSRCILQVCILVAGISTAALSQVSVTATAGNTGPVNYSTLNAAFSAINAGTHQGAITVSITANTTETAPLVPLLKSGVPSSYTSVLIMPSGGDFIITGAGAPTTGRGMIELNGADNVTIDGDDPGTAGNRNLTFQHNTSVNQNVSVIRFASASSTDGATFNTVRNCIITGSRSGSGVSQVNYGIYSGTPGTANATATGQSDNNDNLTIENNIITRCWYGIVCNGTIANYMDNLVIRNNIIGSTTGGSEVAFRGMLLTNTQAIPSPGATVAIVEGNDIQVTGSTGSGSTSMGIELADGNAGALIRKNNIHDIRQPQTLGNGAYGIGISGSNNNSGITISNNFIRDMSNMEHSSGTPLGNANVPYGINVSGAVSNLKIYFNTISLNASNTGSGSMYTFALGVTSALATGLDIRNNIFSNTQATSNAAAKRFAIYLAGTAASITSLNNNNFYFAGTGTGVFLLGNLNGTDRADLASWQTATSQDAASSNVNPNFTSSTDLHIPDGVPSQLESNGVAAGGITTDFDGDTRPGPIGSVNGGATAPDVGADEFDGIPADLTPPLISYSALNGTCSTSDRILTTTIFDASGVPLTGSLAPRIYYSKNAGSYFSSQGLLTSGTGISGTWDFTITASDMGGLIIGDVVSYFVIVQDVASTPNVASSPAGVIATDVNTVSTPPSPNSYLIQAVMGGVINVGTGQAYTTLTDAVNAYNISCLSGPTTFVLTDAIYGSETLPVTIQANSFANATNTLTIKPNSAVAASISGSSTGGIIRLNGADHVIINGLNTGGSSLTLTNSDGVAAVIWIGSASASNGSTYIEVRNCNISGTVSVPTIPGIFLGSGITMLSPAEGANANITIQGCTFTKLKYGIHANGNAITPGANWNFTGNTFGSAITADKLSASGILMFNAQNVSISNNIISGILSGTITTASGIGVFGVINGGNIFKNQISDIKNTNIGAAQGSCGMQISASTTASNLNIFNNFISDVASFGSSGTSITANGWGLAISGGGGYNIYYNTVYLATNQTFANSITAAMFVSGAAFNSLNIRNNIFANTQTVGTNRYAILSNSASNVYVDINYNDYFFAGPNLGFMSGVRANLADWQTATGKDLNSKSIDPLIISATNLHLNPATSPLDSSATPIAGFTDDIDGDPRHVTFPDMGADEFDLPSTQCTGTPDPGGLNESAISICPGFTTTLTDTGYTTGVSGIEFQWEESDDNGTGDPWSSVTGGSGATTFSYTTPQLINTIYYRCKVTCLYSGLFAYSNVCVVNVTYLTLPEDFSSVTFPPGCWTRNNVTYLFRASSSGYGIGDGSAEFNFYSSTFAANLDLATPVFTSTVAGDVLTFDHAYAASSGGGIDSLEILYSTNGGSSYNVLMIYPGGPSGTLNTGGTTGALTQFVPLSSQWATKTVSLPAGTNKIIFRGKGYFGNNLYLDNINIAQPPPCINPAVAGTANGPSSGCTNTTLTYSVTGGSGEYQWQISYDSGPFVNLVNDTNAVLNYSASYLGTYSLRSIRSSSGCPDDTTNTVTTIVSQNGFSVSPAASAITICPGTLVSLTSNTVMENNNQSGDVNQVIPDNNVSGTTDAISVTGISGNLNGTSIRIKSVKLNIGHLRVSDLDITLIAPDNTFIDLSSGNGGTGFDYTNTAFDDNAGTPVTAGTAPFTGSYQPEQPFTTFNSINPNGNWSLMVVDHAAIFTGTLQNWEIVFSDDVSGLTYAWTSAPAGFTSFLQNPNDSPSDTITYLLTVSGGGCSASGSVTVNVLASLPIPYIFPGDTALCTGEILNIVARDSGDYAAGWPAGTTFDFNLGPSTDSTFTVNGPGVYEVSVTLPAGLGGCSATSPIANIVFQDAPVLQVNAVNAACAGTTTGSVSAQVFLGTPPFRFVYYNSAGNIVRDFVSSLSEDTLFNLIAGQYCIVVYDGVNSTYPPPSCKSDSICVTVSEPPVLVASETHDNILCNGGSATVTITATGGTPPYTGTGLFTQSAGSQNYFVTDANGCSTQVSVSLEEPLTITPSVTQGYAPCQYLTGSISASGSGGTPPYAFQWSTGSTNATVTDLGQGTYTVTITDANSCTASLPVQVDPPGAIVVAGTSANLVCRGVATGSIAVSVSGGISPYSFLWAGGATTQNRSGLGAGTYTVTVTDVNGCTKTKSYTLTQPATNLLINTSKTNIRCFGSNTGIASVSPAGGTAPYSYSWNTFPVKTTASISSLPSGTYTCTVTDAAGCSKSALVAITEPTDIAVFQTQSNVTFPGGANGSATVSVSGGTPGYTYSWNTVPVKTTATITGLTSGTYKCSINDSKGCNRKATFIITEPVARPVSPDHTEENRHVSAYPNPTDGVLTIAFTCNELQQVSVSVTDISGRVLFNEVGFYLAGANKIPYDFSAFAKGVYFIRIDMTDRSENIRIIIR